MKTTNPFIASVADQSGEMVELIPQDSQTLTADEGFQEVLRRSFTTATMGFDDDGNRTYFVTIKTKTLADSHAVHDAILRQKDGEVQAPDFEPLTRLKQIAREIDAGDFDLSRREIRALSSDIWAVGSAFASMESGLRSYIKSDAELAEQMKAAGMMSIEETMQPMNRFQVHTGMTDLKFFEQWLERRTEEYVRMFARRTVEKKTDDDMYEWVLAHKAAFHEVLVNFRAALNQGQG